MFGSDCAQGSARIKYRARRSSTPRRRESRVGHKRVCAPRGGFEVLPPAIAKANAGRRQFVRQHQLFVGEVGQGVAPCVGRRLLWRRPWVGDPHRYTCVVVIPQLLNCAARNCPLIPVRAQVIGKPDRAGPGSSGSLCLFRKGLSKHGSKSLVCSASPFNAMIPVTQGFGGHMSRG